MQAKIDRLLGPFDESEFAAQPGQPELVGVRHAYYLTSTILGAGSYGKVYLARTETGRPVAIKSAKNTLTSRGHLIDRVTPALQEAEILKHLDPVSGIVKLLDEPIIMTQASSNLQEAYLVLELLQGATLWDFATLVASHRFADNAERLQVSQQIGVIMTSLTRIVADLSDVKIVHHDLKPNNVMLAADGTVTVFDFGLACSVGDSLNRCKPQGTTSGYDPPETRETLDIPPDYRYESGDDYATGKICYNLVFGNLSQDVSVQRRVERSAVRSQNADLDIVITGLMDPDWRRRMTCRAASEILAKTRISKMLPITILTIG